MVGSLAILIYSVDISPSMWDIDKAVKFLDSHAGPKSHGRCAEWTRRAIEAGGVVLARHTLAKDYGSSLRNVGFVSQGQLASGYRAGDVVIVDGIGGHLSGHMAMFDGSAWVSDFKQPNGLYPATAYATAKARFTIYRYPAVASASPS